MCIFLVHIESGYSILGKMTVYNFNHIVGSGHGRDQLKEKADIKI